MKFRHIVLGLVVAGVIFHFGKMAGIIPEEKKAPPDPYSSNRYAAGHYAVEELKAHLRDPDSLRIDDLYTDEKGDIVCVAYGAKNGFGGMNRAYAYFDMKSKGFSQAADAWNRHCVGKGFFDVSAS